MSTGGPFDLLVFENYTPVSAAEITAPVFFVDPPVDGLLPASGVMTTATVQHRPLGRSVADGRRSDRADRRRNPHPPARRERCRGRRRRKRTAALSRRRFRVRATPMVVLTFDLQESPLPQRIAFPILMANVVRSLAPAALPASAALGDPVAIEPRAGAETVRVTSPSGVETDIPVTLDAGGAVETAIYPSTGEGRGIHSCRSSTRSGQVTASGSFVVNAGHPVESNLRANPDLPGVLAQAQVADERGRNPAAAGRSLAGAGGAGAWDCWRSNGSGPAPGAGKRRAGCASPKGARA